MMALHQALVDVAIVWAVLLVVGFLMVMVRGRSVLDHLLAVDGAAMCLIAVLALLAVRRHEVAHVDGALALALLAFVATVAAARFQGGSS